MYFYPSEEFQAKANLKEREYLDLMSLAKEDPEKFWAKLAREELHWKKDFKQCLEKDEQHNFNWFSGGKLNIAENCLDIHLRDKEAIIFEGEPGDQERYSYAELTKEVCKLAAVLEQLEISAGDRVAIYMPLCPQAIIAMLACMRIGAIHSVVFGGFSSKALHERIVDAGAKLLISSDTIFRKGKMLLSLETAYEAVSNSPCKKILNFRRSAAAAEKSTLVNYDFENFTKASSKIYAQISKSDIEIFDWHELIASATEKQKIYYPEANETSFILYTSGSTGKPKGIEHRQAGYLLWTKVTSKWVLDLKDTDTYWCTADPGWITGHSYLAYGPLANGATCFITEAAPNYPDPSRFWQMIEKYQVNIFYTAPTAIRAFIQWGEEFYKKYDLSSLRLLGSVGEPINPETWQWFYKEIGKEKCPIVDTWWQTETGGFMISTMPGFQKMIAGKAGQALPGIEAQTNEKNLLNISSPWPSMLKGVYKNPERYQKAYWTEIPNSYCAGDAALINEESYIQIIGRTDDVINVSGHRLGSAEIESALVSHANVHEAAVVSSTDQLTGEQINAFVVGEKTEIKDLQDHVAKEIASMAKPKTITFCKALPKTRSGKIMRRILKQIAAGEQVSGDLSSIEDARIIPEIEEAFKVNLLSRAGD